MQRVITTDIHSKNIIAYIEYLKTSGFTVTLHGAFINNSIFMNYNYHQNPYCHYVKTVYGKWDICIKNQQKVMRMSEKGSFFGCCYAGVGEFVYPVEVDGAVSGFISVSGYKNRMTADKSNHFALKYSLEKDEIKRLCDKYLKADIPDKAMIDAVIEPLVFMLEAYFSRHRGDLSAEGQLYHKILRYVTENCHSRITMKQLSRQFNYSVSTLSHLFLKNSGKSLPEFIDDLRLNEAKWYLANSNTSITEIAMFLGYNNSNYFSSVFKSKQGMTPREYRRNSQNFK